MKLERRRSAGPAWVMRLGPVEELFEHDADLDAGQVGTEAEVRAAATEADMVVRRATDVEPHRIVEHRLVAIGREVVHDHRITCGDGDPGDLGVLRRGPPELHDRARPTDDLLGHRFEQIGPAVAEALHLVGMVEQPVEPVADRVAGRLVAGHRQQQHEDVELVVVELVALVRREQGGDDVVAWIVAACLGQLVGIGVELHHRRLALGERCAVFGVVGTDHAVRPVEDLAAVLDGHPQQLGDGHERQFGSDLGHEVERALLLRAVDDGAGHVAVVALERADHPGREPAVDELAEAGVVGRIGLEHGAGHVELFF